jgi:hypothetical protein
LRRTRGPGTVCAESREEAAMGIGIREILIILVVGIGFIIWFARRKD